MPFFLANTLITAIGTARSTDNAKVQKKLLEIGIPVRKLVVYNYYYYYYY
jgi:hypothetical protein